MESEEPTQMIAEMFKKLLTNNEVSNSIPYDILENNNEIIIYAQLPGVTKDNIKIGIYNNKLKITAKTLPLYKIEDYTTYKYIGIDYSDKELKIDLPVALTNESHVNSHLKYGVLYIRIDRSKETDKSFNITLD